jgi:S-adenosylmethionine:tRNA ribosyltransferase-isomerase
VRVEDLDFHLPPASIATAPAEPRDAARLLVLSRSDPARLEHRVVRDLPGLLAPDDLLVLNRSRVLPARFEGRNLDTGGRIEGLWLRDDGRDAQGRRVWVALVKARRHRPGRVLGLVTARGDSSPIRLELLEPAPDEPGAWRIAVRHPAGDDPETPDILDRVGRPPLPPYIRHARRDRGLGEDDDRDAERYQTVFAASCDSPTGEGAGGSVAAPTAGLHFTPDLLGRLAAAGVRREEVLLHVGTGTFKPVEVEDLDQHPMHREWCSMTPAARRAVFGAGRVIAVGTTAARTIEAHALAIERGEVPPAWLETDLLIQPGYRWRRVDGLLTNFHLPRSTLLALVAGIIPGGIDRVRSIYDTAIREGYRFYSFGDAMLILP